MKDPNEILAWLLAAEEYPHLREEPLFQQAEKALQASTDLQRRFDESKAFFAAHPVLTRIEGMPADSRKRIEAVLRNKRRERSSKDPMILRPWGVRRNFAWAAVLVLLLAGMSVISSNIIRENERRERRNLVAARNLPPTEAFHRFAGELADGPPPLQHRANDNTQLVSWLEEQGAPRFATPQSLSVRPTMGCAYLDGPVGKVALLCFSTENGVVHLFITSVENLKLKGDASPRKIIVNQRNALEWHDSENAYLLIGHDVGQDLPEVFL